MSEEEEKNPLLPIYLMYNRLNTLIHTPIHCRLQRLPTYSDVEWPKITVTHKLETTAKKERKLNKFESHSKYIQQ